MISLLRPSLASLFGLTDATVVVEGSDPSQNPGNADAPSVKYRVLAGHPGCTPAGLSYPAASIPGYTCAAKAYPADREDTKKPIVVLVHGKVVDVHRRTEAGFARGQATLVGFGMDEGRTVELAFQNEHLVATEIAGTGAEQAGAEQAGAEVAGDGAQRRVLASVPDLICVVDADTGEPVTTEAMRYGFRVTVLALPAHERWRTPAGLALVGPRYFGYDHDYVPIGRASVGPQ
jgi:hypothetical protein